jgi:hypothetical protein
VSPIDAHTHLFPPGLIARRETLLRADAWFGQAFASPKARMIDEELLLASMDKAGIALSVVAGWPWADPGLCHEHNAYLADVARRYPDRIAWMGIINPADPASEREIAWCVSQGAVGFGEVNADSQGFDWADPGAIRGALGVLAEAHMPLMIHTSEPVGHAYGGKGTATPDRLLQTVAAHPEVRFVMAHWGGGLPFYELMPEVNALTRNVVYDSAASTYLYDFMIFPLLERVLGPERILFGSDFPVLAQGRFLQRVLASGLPGTSLPAILAGNARRIYRLPEGDAP